MARPKKERKKLPAAEAPMSLRIPPVLRKEIAKVAEIMGRSEADVIRLATEIGLEHLDRIDYKLAKAVVDSSEKNDTAHIPYLGGVHAERSPSSASIVRSRYPDPDENFTGREITPLAAETPSRKKSSPE